MPKLSVLTPEQAHAVSLIGKPVTVGDRQYRLHSVEGGDWYTHLSTDGMIVIDQGLSGGQWITFPIATLIPAGHTLGDGFSETHALDQVKRGVTLSKTYA